MKKHTKANGYYKGECHWSKTGWAWHKANRCTCIVCKPPKNEKPKERDK